jgi:hypothetical protein
MDVFTIENITADYEKFAEFVGEALLPLSIIPWPEQSQELPTHWHHLRPRPVRVKQT